MGLARSDRGDRGIRQSLPSVFRGSVLLLGNYPYPFIFWDSSTLIALIGTIATLKPMIFRCVFAERGRLCSATPRYVPIALLLKIRSKNPHILLFVPFFK